jgi:hypothetical protein
MENQTIEEFLLQDSENILRLPFKYKDWLIYPLSMDQVVKIQPYVAKITKIDLDGLQESIENGRMSYFIEFFGKYGKDIIFIVNTIAGEDISEKATPDDYMALLIGTLYRMGKSSFLKSINLIQRLSLQTRAGLIAAEKRYVTSMTSQKLS